MNHKTQTFLFSTVFLLACQSGNGAGPDPIVDDPAPTVDPSTSSVLELAYIALEDNGASGPLVGCGDSEILITKESEAALNTKQRIQTALETLFEDKEQFKENSGLYNALYQSSLTVDAVTINRQTVTVELSGETRSGGECDDPRIVEQIQGTVENNLDSDKEFTIIINLNGNPLEKLQDLSGQ